MDIIEYIEKNKKRIIDEGKSFSGFKIAGAGKKCLKLNSPLGEDEFISWDEFNNNDDKYSVDTEIKNYYQQFVGSENEKEIKKAISFIKEDEKRVECLKKAVAGDKSFKESPEFDNCMTQELCNYAGASQLGRAVIKALEEEGEERESSPKTSSTPETKKSEKRIITEKEKISMENHLSRIFKEDVTIVLGEFSGTRKPDNTIKVDGITFEIYNSGSCVLFAYPKNIEVFETEQFKLNGRHIKTLELIKRSGKEDGYHQYERDILDEKEYIKFEFSQFKYVLTEKGKEALNNASKGVDNMANDMYTIVQYQDEKPKIGDTIYGTTSSFDYNCMSGTFENCSNQVKVKVKEISSDFTDYEQNKCHTGGKYGYFEWKVMEVE